MTVKVVGGRTDGESLVRSMSPEMRVINIQFAIMGMADRMATSERRSMVASQYRDGQAQADRWDRAAGLLVTRAERAAALATAAGLGRQGCGTARGYLGHAWRGSTPCAPCEAAWLAFARWCTVHPDLNKGKRGEGKAA